MTASPDLIHELRASRPTAPAVVRAKVREIAVTEVGRRAFRLRLPSRRRLGLVVVPAVAALALVAAGLVGLTHPRPQETAAAKSVTGSGAAPPVPQTSPRTAPRATDFGPTAGSGALTTPNRAQRVTATVTVEVADSDAVSNAAQDALDTTRSLGGYVVTSSVSTGSVGRASLTVRVPVEKVQEAIVAFSSLGRITSQQVTVDDLQESLDALTRRAASLRSQIMAITARLDRETLDPETRAPLEARRRELRSELRATLHNVAATGAEARLATMELMVVTPDALGVVPPSSRLDRTVGGALNALVWEGVVALALAIVAAPFALAAIAVWLARRIYRRREDDRLLAAS